MSFDWVFALLCALDHGPPDTPSLLSPLEPVCGLLRPRSPFDSGLIHATYSIKAVNELASPVNFIGKLLMPFRKGFDLHNG